MKLQTKACSVNSNERSINFEVLAFRPFVDDFSEVKVIILGLFQAY